MISPAIQLYSENGDARRCGNLCHSCGASTAFSDLGSLEGVVWVRAETHFVPMHDRRYLPMANDLICKHWMGAESRRDTAF